MSKTGMGLGASIVSNNILKNKANIKWIFREDSVDELDNGWRFLSEIDTCQILKTCQYATGVQLLKLNLRYYRFATCLLEQNSYLFTKVRRSIS